MTTEKRVADTDLILNTIEYYTEKNLLAPTYRELSELTGLPLGTCHAIVSDLKNEGRVHHVPNIARSIRVVQ